MQELGKQAVDLKTVGTPYDDPRKNLGEIIVGIRVDAVPANDAERLAEEGKFYPLTTDKNGFLRVVQPEGTSVETPEIVALLTEIRDLMIEQRDLLLRIA